MNGSRLQVAVLFPELLGTYGDGGNVLVLQRRLAWHHIAGDVVQVGLGQPVPAGCDLYLLGGGEDQAQAAALTALHRSCSEGAMQGSIIASYPHGPVLARNPALADLLLTRATAQVLAPLELAEERALRCERLTPGPERARQPVHSRGRRSASSRPVDRRPADDPDPEPHP